MINQSHEKDYFDLNVQVKPRSLLKRFFLLLLFFNLTYLLRLNPVQIMTYNIPYQMQCCTLYEYCFKLLMKLLKIERKKACFSRTQIEKCYKKRLLKSLLTRTNSGGSCMNRQQGM